MPLRRKRSWMNWDGLEPVAAWQPLHAPSFRDSLWDWRSAFASIGTAPEWSPVSGWYNSDGQKYLDTGVVPAVGWSALVRFSGATSRSYNETFGMRDGTRFFGITTIAGGQYYENGGYAAVAGDVASGVAGIAGSSGYLNGVAVTSAIGAWTGNAVATAYLCNQNGGTWGPGSPANGFVGYIQAIAFYDKILAAEQMWLRSQMLAHLECADWSIWTPARRWFFVPPPIPPAATPVLSTIYINTADIGDTSLFDDVSGATVSATYARTGAKSFKLAIGAYQQANLTSSATKYTKFGLLVTDTPASDALLCAWQETGTQHVSLYLTNKLTLQMRQGSTIIQTSPTTLETETWYCVEAKVVVHDTIGRFQVRIDGVDDMSAIGICTDADVDGAINEIRFESPVDDTYIDDIVVREDQWCGIGGVYVVVPTAGGTVEDWSGSYADVDDLPPSFTDYISATTGSSSDHLFRHSGMAGDYDIRVVDIFAKGRLSATADDVLYALARSSTTDDTGDSQDLDTTGVYARLLMTTNPNGSVAWTTHAVNNALQIGVEA